MRHPNESALIAHVERPSAEIDAHAAACATCARILSEFRRLDQALRDDLPWLIAQAVPSKVHAPGRESGRPQGRHRRERLSMSLNSRGSAELWAVRGLITRAHALLESDPGEALRTADEALKLVADLAGDPNDVRYARASAQKERANALRYLGRFKEALDALAAAEGDFATLLTGEFEVGIVEQIRASVLREQTNFEGARRSANNALRIFRLFGDHQRALRAELALANLAFESGDFASSREAYEKLLPAAARTGDSRLLASLHNNLGHAFLQLEDFTEAGVHLSRAGALFEAAGQRQGVLRVRWALARIEAREQLNDQAIESYTTLADEFQGMGMKIDAALVRLDLAEVLIREERGGEAAALCREVVNQFIDEHVKVAAATALATLRDSVAHESVRADLILQARAALEECRQTEPPN